MLQYGIECWGKAADYILQPIKVLQKHAIRALAGASWGEHTKPIFNKLKLLSLEGLHKRALASAIHRKALEGSLPLTLEHNYQFRQIQKFPPPKGWLNKKARRQVNFQSPLFTSTLPDHLLQYIGKPSFLKKLKQHLLLDSTNSNQDQFT